MTVPVVPKTHSDDRAHKRVIANAINWLLGLFDTLDTAESGKVFVTDGNGGWNLQYMTDYALEVARGNITGVTGVNKFGRCSDNVDSGVLTDIWDGSNTANANVVWDAPTTARVHSIASSSASDTSAGVGARTVQVYGLTSWDTAETSEVITMNGTTGVNTTNSYVIIHRMKVLTKGATDINVGRITATAATDATVTAYIEPSQGQTEMAIYGVPSTQKAYMTMLYASINRANAGSVDIELLVNPEPDTELTNFQVKTTLAIHSTGSTFMERIFSPYPCYAGPCIIKVAGSGSANNLDVSAGFDLYLVDN